MGEANIGKKEKGVLYTLSSAGELAVPGGTEPPRGYIVDSGEASADSSLARELRKRPETALTPVFFKGEPSDGEKECLDGFGLSVEEMQAISGGINEKLRDLEDGPLQKNLSLRLLTFLYSRDGKKLRPVLDPFSDGLYSYPLADYISGELMDSSRWISELLDQGYLEEGDLVDRIRACPKCGGAHLNYVDICPSCRSMDIRQVPFIHCFTCGRVGTQDAFLREGSLQCPYCETRLRHIGSDYDRPMENYLCSSCSQIFVEPEVSCRCLLCGEWSLTDALQVRSFREYSLSERGIMAVRTGTTDDMYSVFDSLNYTKPEPFRHILDWQLQLSDRPPVEPFSLMIISFPNIDDLKGTVGRARVTEMLEGLSKRLRESIRKTDVSTRTAENDLLLLLPKTGEKGAQSLAAKLKKLEEETLQPDGASLKILVKTAVFPKDRIKGEDSPLLIARLKG